VYLQKNFSHQQYLAKEEYGEKRKHYEIHAQGYTKNMKISMLSLNRNLITQPKQQKIFARASPSK
jgi:hypothetical protein